MAQHVIETVTFKLSPDADPKAFVTAAEVTGAWIKAQPCFVRRRLSRAEDGTWIEHVEWADMETSKAAAARIGEEPGDADFLKAIDGPSVSMMHSALEISVN